MKLCKTKTPFAQFCISFCSNHFFLSFLSASAVGQLSGLASPNQLDNLGQTSMKE